MRDIERDLIVKRLLAVVEKDPSITIELLTQRFNLSRSSISRLLKQHGIKLGRTSYVTRAEARAAMEQVDRKRGRTWEIPQDD